VQQGECLSSIGARYGFAPDTLWNLSENAALKQRRQDPNVLESGDVVFVPELRPKSESVGTEQKHRFRKKSGSAVLRLQLLDRDDRPRANLPYTLAVEGRLITGRTDGQGMVEQRVDSHAGTASLIIEGEDPLPLRLGGLDPVDTVTGVQQRLQNLGFACGRADGTWDERCAAALRAFREQYGLPEADEVDQAARDKLRDVHGS
jgi:hypothetical protein